MVANFKDGSHYGSSPRVRSGLGAQHVHAVAGGIISACAERTECADAVGDVVRDHLRVCGADIRRTMATVLLSGSSPRVRSGPNRRGAGREGSGIISACAERTPGSASSTRRRRDHLRVCGADDFIRRCREGKHGSSPRVRSGPLAARHQRDAAGIISACAERTNSARWAGPRSRDHLRVCGADFAAAWSWAMPMGSSPRVRSGPVAAEARSEPSGIISACAERTEVMARSNVPPEDHLRVCGADMERAGESPFDVGSSPRVRSGHTVGRVCGCRVGIISACAERTVVFYCGLGWSGVAEYLIHALRGVGKRRGCQYLE